MATSQSLAVLLTYAQARPQLWGDGRILFQKDGLVFRSSHRAANCNALPPRFVHARENALTQGFPLQTGEFSQQREHELDHRIAFAVFERFDIEILDIDADAQLSFDALLSQPRWPSSRLSYRRTSS